MGKNTTGTFNTAYGFYALVCNTIASGNTATGACSLYANTTGAQNTASGYRAMAGNTCGYDNTAMGWSAMCGNTTGYNLYLNRYPGSTDSYIGSSSIISCGVKIPLLDLKACVTSFPM